jgi:predicted nucleic acid-binding protein
MKGLDTNVLVRYLTQDDPKQAALAAKVFEEAAAKEEKMLLHALVFCELIWVLETAYEFAKEDILKVLEKSCGLHNSRSLRKNFSGWPWRIIARARGISQIITSAGPTRKREPRLRSPLIHS